MAIKAARAVPLMHSPNLSFGSFRYRRVGYLLHMVPAQETPFVNTFHPLSLDFIF